MGWIKVLRLPIVIAAGFLSIVSFRIADWDRNAYTIALFVVVAASATMAHNDWRDRFHDAKNGKDFALVHNSSFPVFVATLWGISLGLAAFLWRVQSSYGMLSVAMVTSGLIYSETRRIPFLPVLLVAATSASPALYPILMSASKESWLLFSAAFLLIFGREILKDLDDFGHDSGYKWTLPHAIGTKRAKVVSGLFLLVVSAVVLGISPWVLAGIPFLFVSVIILFMDKGHKLAKITVDIAMVVILVVLAASGP